MIYLDLYDLSFHTLFCFYAVINSPKEKIIEKNKTKIQVFRLPVPHNGLWNVKHTQVRTVKREAVKHRLRSDDK